MEDEEKIKLFINDCTVEINNRKLNENEYCIIVYVSKKVEYVYKNILDFEYKILSNIKNIDTIASIDFEMWIFD